MADSGLDVILTLVGTGDSKQEYQNQAISLGIRDRVRFVGYVPREEIGQYYNSADVFALPSYNEGMSLAVLEAMAAGLPVVALDASGVREVVKDKKNGRLLFDDTVPAFAAALQEMINLPAEKM